MPADCLNQVIRQLPMPREDRADLRMIRAQQLALAFQKALTGARAFAAAKLRGGVRKLAVDDQLADVMQQTERCDQTAINARDALGEAIRRV